MSHDLYAAAIAARYLASMVASIRGLLSAGAAPDTIKRLTDELDQSYPDASAAIRAVAMELRRTRDRAVRFGDVVAATAHEAAKEMVLALNRERFGVEIVSYGNVRVWPDVREVIAEIELETARAVDRRAHTRTSTTSLPEGECGVPATQPETSARHSAFLPTRADITILTVLGSAGRRPLKQVEIVREAAKLTRGVDRKLDLDPVSSTVLGERLPLLLEHGYVTRPLNADGRPALRKGVGITAAGRELLKGPSAV